jgi:predicted alpha/beta-hydrolase family hydrolase
MVNFSQGFASSGPGAGLVMFPGNMNLKARAAVFDRVKQYELQQEYMKSAARQEMKLAYGGRSLGARAAVVASHADEDVKMLVLVSYPLVAPSGDVRDKILLEIRPDVDVLFISGDHDSMCDLDMLDGVRGKMAAKTWIVRVRGADHGMNLRGGKKLKEGTKLVGEATGKMAATWLRERDQQKRQIDITWDGERSQIISSGWLASATTKQGKEKSEDVAEQELPKAEEETGNPKRKKVKR